jgi:hypothetical protein
MRVFQYYSCRLSKKRESTFECRLRKYIIKFIRFCKINILLFLFSLRSRRTESRARSTNRNLLRSQTRWIEHRLGPRPEQHISQQEQVPIGRSGGNRTRHDDQKTTLLHRWDLSFHDSTPILGNGSSFVLCFALRILTNKCLQLTLFAINFVCNIFYNN